MFLLHPHALDQRGIDVPVPISTPAPPSARPGPRFTRDGSTRLEQRLGFICERIRTCALAIVPARKLEAVLLGGGYGRGEGGVLATSTGDEPYNDLECYVCIHGNRFGNRRRYGKRFHELSEQFEGVVGLPVEFKIISLEYLRRSPPSMFFYDLIEGHRWIHGHEGLLRGCEHHRDPRRIPWSEAIRLLMNRLSGLLFARVRLEHLLLTDDDADFVGRNLAKLQMALGDAVLAAAGQYHWSCLVRRERMQTVEQVLEGIEAPPFVAWLDEVRQNHAQGVEFKLHPTRKLAPPEVLRRQYDTLRALGLRVWLWLEEHRLGQPFPTTRDYALSREDKCPEIPTWKSALLNLRARGFRALGLNLFRAPQDRILRALAILLGETGDPGMSVRLPDDLLHCAQKLLQTRATTRLQLVHAYTELWRRLN